MHLSVIRIHMKLGHQCSVVFCWLSCDRIFAGGVGDNYEEFEGVILAETLNCFDGFGSALCGARNRGCLILVQRDCREWDRQISIMT